MIHNRDGPAGAICATHAKQSCPSDYCERNEMVAAVGELPTSGYALEVDGRLKAEFTTRDGAKAGAEELKRRFPTLRVRIYDAQTMTREEVLLQRA